MPVRAAAAATWRVWFDCTPPIDTSVSQPCASASATRYSSFRVLLPPYARPELQSSRFAQISTPPPRCSLSRSSRCTGDGPNRSGTRSKLGRLICESLLVVFFFIQEGGLRRSRALENPNRLCTPPQCARLAQQVQRPQRLRGSSIRVGVGERQPSAQQRLRGASQTRRSPLVETHAHPVGPLPCPADPPRLEPVFDQSLDGAQPARPVVT